MTLLHPRQIVHQCIGIAAGVVYCFGELQGFGSGILWNLEEQADSDCLSSFDLTAFPGFIALTLKDAARRCLLVITGEQDWGKCVFKIVLRLGFIGY